MVTPLGDVNRQPVRVADHDEYVALVVRLALEVRRCGAAWLRLRPALVDLAAAVDAWVLAIDTARRNDEWAAVAERRPHPTDSRWDAI